MHPLYTPQFAAEHIASLHERAARSRLAAALKDGQVPTVRPSRARPWRRARRPRPATT